MKERNNFGKYNNLCERKACLLDNLFKEGCLLDKNALHDRKQYNFTSLFNILSRILSDWVSDLLFLRYTIGNIW